MEKNEADPIRTHGIGQHVSQDRGHGKLSVDDRRVIISLSSVKAVVGSIVALILGMNIQNEVFNALKKHVTRH